MPCPVHRTGVTRGQLPHFGHGTPCPYYNYYNKIMIAPGTRVEDLDTPCLLVDLARMETNIRDWQSAVGARGCCLRPHTKTHKTPAIARLQLAAGARGLTVAKVSEAEVYADAGGDDIFVAYPVIGEIKWRRAAGLARRISLIVGVDSEVGARGLSAAAQQAGSTIKARIKVDMGLGRAGVTSQNMVALGHFIESLPNLQLDGIFVYRSVHHPQAAGYSAEELGREEGDIAVALADEMRAAGLEIRSVSAGSTPTGRAAAQVPGVTEVRPGTYVFGDEMLANSGVMARDQLALSILCTVVSRPSQARATIDGGSKTFAGDLYPPKYGCEGYAREVGGASVVESLSEEHGIVALADGANPRIGDKIAWHPIHVCTTVNLADELVGIRENRVECVWPIEARGKRT